MKRTRPVCRSCGVQLVTGHKDDPEYHWEWCKRKTLRGRMGRGNVSAAGSKS